MNKPVARDDYIELVEEKQPEAKEPIRLVNLARKSSATHHYQPRDPLTITLPNKDLSLCRTFVAAANHTFMALIDPSSLKAAKSFGYFRNPLETAYLKLVPILREHEPCFRSSNPIPKVQFMHSLSVTLDPSNFTMIVKFIYEDGNGFHRHYTLRIIPQGIDPKETLERVATRGDQPHPRLPARI